MKRTDRPWPFPRWIPVLKRSRSEAKRVIQSVKNQTAQNLWEQSLLAIAVSQSAAMLTALSLSRASFATTGLWLN
ncbi:protein of unknown function [Pseudomonas mediterranea]